MAKCCIRGCNSNSRRNYEGLSFFRFPKKEDLRKLWIDNIGSENIKPAPLLKICSKHFEESCINRTLDVVRLKDDVVPTLFPFTSSSVQPRLALSEKTDNSGNTIASPQHNIEIDDSMPIQREPLQLSKSAEQDFMDITMDIDEPKIIFTQQQSTSLLPKTAGQCSTHFTMGGDSSISIHTQQLQLQSTSGVSKCLAHDTMVSPFILFCRSREQYISSLIEKKSRGGLTYPSQDLTKIILKTENIVKQNLIYKENPEKYYIYIYKFIMEHFENDRIFSNTSREHESAHKLLLIKAVIIAYLDLRYAYYGRKHTEHVSKRNFLTKLVLFRHE